MSAVPSPAVPSVAPAPTRSIKPGEVLIIGKLTAARRPGSGGTYWTHLVVLPSADSYSSPSTVEILATRRLGERDEEVRVLCKVGGFRRAYKATDKETGEIRQVHTADNKLFAVED